MENFDFQSIIKQIQTQLIGPVEKFLTGLPQESLYLILAAAGLIALLAAVFGYLLLRPKPKKNNKQQGPTDFVHFFQKSGTIMDIAAAVEHNDVLGRAVLTAVKPDRIRLEIIEENGIARLSSPAELILMFPPEKSMAGKVNSFRARISSLECDDEGCGRMTLTPPTKFKLVKRRKHKRKRVVDQQFIRVKLWLGRADSSDTSFADRIPDLAVNSYDPRSSGHEENQVINISNGGIGVGASPMLVESKFNIDDDVLISIFMFNFRQKVFKPYWYAGKIRSMENMDGQTCRVGVEFTVSGKMRDENEQHIDWTHIK
ncbi:PilZ domain-containing protein [Desulfovibrio sp. JC010]|uniref:PilZ domain-containing protein n=1 Tax=Desulfovibrio sp. JC010 TaxID=2593641 RepID=UPI0013D050F2|nr:PilZ domain-containing protein [Desulfovibrio sp. JC010]NDV25704.1 PilZ domain-containing protein [Desulfovibrio sp. JC010]